MQWLFLFSIYLNIEDLGETKLALIRKYQKTPDIPLFIQYHDWPLCCKDITEFIGYPASEEELYTIGEHCIYWEKQISGKKIDFRKIGNPESFKEVSKFQCLHCRGLYFTFQFT